MVIMAVACGVLMVVFGFWSTGLRPTEGESAIQMTCLVGGLILCFLAVVLARLGRLAARLDTIEDGLAAADQQADGSFVTRDEAAA